MSKRFVSAVLCMAWLMLAGGLAQAQVTTGTVLGTVTDTTGGVLPGVTVTVKNAETGRTSSVVTDSAGRYRQPSLQVGQYEVTAELAGFQTQTRKALPLVVGSDMLVNFALGVTGVEEKVEVTSEAPLVQATTAEVSSVVDQKLISEIPLNARDIQQLATFQLGVQRNSYNNLGANMVVAGARSETNRFLLNGIDTTFTFGVAPVSAAGIIMGAEAVEEFKLLTTDYSAAYGEKAGGVLNTVTKSGTNSFRGTAYEFFRHNKLDAPNYFDRAGTPPFNRNQYGASLGGPISRNKTFFFTNVERFRQRLGQSLTAFVPSARARQGYLPDPANPGREILVGVAPSVAPYLKFWPEPNGRALADGSAEYFSNPQQAIDETYWTLRGDHNMGQHDMLSVVYTGDWSKELTPTQNPTFANNRDYDRHIVSVQNVHTFSSNLVNTTRAGFNKTWYFHRTDTLVDVDRSLYFVPDPFFAPTDNGQFGLVTITGMTGLGETGTGTNITPRWFDYKMWTAMTDFNYMRGAHSIQFGASFKKTYDNTLVANPAGRGSFTFSSLQTFLQGRPQSFAVYVPSESQLDRQWRNETLGLYVEDTIRARANLTINIGARTDLSFGPQEAKNRISNLKSLTDAKPTVGGPYFDLPRNLISPRVGVNWDPTGKGHTSVRFGASHTFDLIVPNTYFITATGAAPFARNVTVTNPPFPNALGAIPANSPIDYTAFDNAGVVPDKYSWNAAVQQQLGAQTSVTVGYVGNESRHQIRAGNENAFQPTMVNGQPFWPAGLTQRPNPNFRTITMTRFDADSTFRALTVAAQRRVGDGFSATFNYTVGNCENDVSNNAGGGSLNGGATLQNPYDRTSSRGPCSYFAKNSLNLITSWQLPGKNLSGAAGALLGGWMWSTATTFQSGYPFDLQAGFNNSRQGETGTGPDRPSWASGCDASKAILGTSTQWFDPACFVLADPGSLGNVPAGALRGPKLLTSDWAFSKFISVGGSRRLEMRLEAFNIFNRANFAVPSARALFRNDRTRIATAGRITQTVTPSRQIQLGVKYVF